MDYDSHIGNVMPASLKLAKRESLHSLNKVEGIYGQKYANVVSACLQAKASNHIDIVRYAIAALMDLKDEFEDADDMI